MIIVALIIVGSFAFAATVGYVIGVAYGTRRERRVRALYDEGHVDAMKALLSGHRHQDEPLFEGGGSGQAPPPPPSQADPRLIAYIEDTTLSREDIYEALVRRYSGTVPGALPGARHDAEVELAEFEAGIRTKALGEVAKELYRAAQKERGETRHAPGLRHAAHIVRSMIE